MLLRLASGPTLLTGIPHLMSVAVKSVVLCNRQLPVNFRYALLATEIARRCNMSRKANNGNDKLYSMRCPISED